MIRILAIFILFHIFLGIPLASAKVPQKIQAHIDRDFDLYIQPLLDLDYSEQQKDLVLDRYIDGLEDEYRLKRFDRSEVRVLLHSLLEKTTYSQRRKLRRKFVDGGSIDIRNVKNFVLKYREKKDSNFVKINILYDGFEIPLFLKNFGDATDIYLDGISKDSKKWPTIFLTGWGAVDTLFTKNTLPCLGLTYTEDKNSAKIEAINASYTACPIPGNKTGTFLLELAQELARNLDKKYVKLVDKSMVRCEKNNQSAKLALLRVFQRGDTWYGSQGFREIDESKDKAIMASYQSLPLRILVSELEGKTKEKLKATKKRLLSKAETSEDKRKIEKDYLDFGGAKGSFESAIETFKEFNKITRRQDISMGQFFSWLWQYDCERYISITRLLFFNSFNKDLSTQKLDPLPKVLSKRL